MLFLFFKGYRPFYLGGPVFEGVLETLPRLVSWVHRCLRVFWPFLRIVFPVPDPLCIAS